MPNTYTQIYLHIVFAVKGRQNLLPEQHREEIHKYITGVVRERGHKMLAVFCMPDHVHILAGIKPAMSISDLVRDIKTGSSNFINGQKWIPTQFNWQEGYGAFSYSRSQIDGVIKYILGQEEHHKRKSFRDEYVGLIKEFGIEYDEKYLFEWIE